MPIFRAVETFAIFVDFIKLRGYNKAGARNCVTKRSDVERHLNTAEHLKVRGPSAKSGEAGQEENRWTNI